MMYRGNIVITSKWDKKDDSIKNECKVYLSQFLEIVCVIML